MSDNEKRIQQLEFEREGALAGDPLDRARNLIGEAIEMAKTENIDYIKKVEKRLTGLEGRK